MPVNGTLSREVAKMGWGVTVTTAVAVLVPALARTDALPTAAPTTTPLGARRTAGSLVLQVTRVSTKRRPALSTPTAVSRRASPKTITALSGWMYSESQATAGPVDGSVVYTESD